jgi:hypothetical protein
MRKNARGTLQKSAVCLALSAGLAGCDALRGSLDPAAVSPRGLNSSVEALNYTGVATLQDGLVAALKLMAGLSGISVAYRQDPNWQLVLKAGFELVGGQCDEYLSALFKFDREQRALRQGLTATGATAATIMGLTATPAAPIAGTAAAFGFAATLFDANVNSVLFQLEPSAIRNIVIKSEDAYRETTTSNLAIYQSRPDVLLGLQGYLRLCTPAAIEYAINQAASTSQFEAKPGQSKTDPSPGLLQTSSAAVSLGTVTAADKASSDAALAIEQLLAPLSNNQVLVMARAMFPTWTQSAGVPALAPVRSIAAFSDWQTDPAHARALMATWLSTDSGPLAPWTAALAAAIHSPK